MLSVVFPFEFRLKGLLVAPANWAISSVLVQSARARNWLVEGHIFGKMLVTAVTVEEVFESCAGVLRGCSG